MYYNTSKNNHNLKYNPFKALVVPRPIGWISTISKEGLGNLAPFSFFNALNYDPPFVMFSGGSKKNGEKKDTVNNAEQVGEFVVNIANWETRKQMDETSWILESGLDELSKVGLTAVPSIEVSAARVLESPIHFECKYHKTILLPGNTPQAVHYVIIGKVIGIHIKDEFITKEGLVDTVKMNIIARLGYNDYIKIKDTFTISDNDDLGKMVTTWNK